MTAVTEKSFKRKLEGIVISNKNSQSIVVNVQRRFKDARYSKFINMTKKYHAHDAKDQAKVGDMVTIIESRPHSKLKNWELLKIKQSNAL
jgi:small subunit ribosomal protein S17